MFFLPRAAFLLLQPASRVFSSARSLGEPRSSRQLFHNLPHKYTANPESGALIRQSQQNIFPLSAYGGHTPQIDDESVSAAISQSFLPKVLQLVGPGSNELAFQDQLALLTVIDSGDLQHS
jgi:hypothetical protein